MADSSTTNHNFILPEIGSSKDTWGTKLNSNFSALDNLLRTAANSVFLPRSGGGNVTGSLVFTAHATYDARVGQTDFPLSVRRKSDNAIAFRFDGGAGLDGSAPDARSVLNRAMGDTRYVRPDQQNTLTANAQAQLLVGHTARVLTVRRKTDNLDTHNIFDADVTNPDLASDPRSILTRAMGDNRYLKLAGGNSIAGTQVNSGEARYIGVKDGVIAIGGPTTTPFYAQRGSDNMVTHVILDADITSPDDPTHQRSILTRTMGDRRYPQKDAVSVYTAEQTFNARNVFGGNALGRLFVGQDSDSPLYIVRKSDAQITHIIPDDDITAPDTPSNARSILTRTMGDGRYAQRSQSVSAGDGLVGGGALSGNISLAVNGTVARRSVSNLFSSDQHIIGNLVLRGSTPTLALSSPDNNVSRAMLYSSSANNLTVLRAYTASGLGSKDFVFDGGNGEFVAGAFVGDGSKITNINAGNLNPTTTLTYACLPKSHVLARTGQADVAEIGTYAMLQLNSSGGTVTPGQNVAASAIAGYSSASGGRVTGTVPAGSSWKCMGYVSGSVVGDRTTLFLRVS